MWPPGAGSLEWVTLESVDMLPQVQGLGGVTLESVMLPQAQGLGGGHPGVLCRHVTPGTGSGSGSP